MATKAAYIDYDEGSAPATPATGDVRLYAKTDGLLYSKDDAGTETLVSGGAGGGGGDITTDAAWAAAGDLIVGTGNDTAGILSLGNAGGALTRINGAVEWNSGTSFPGSAAAGDRYWRTDLGMECYYDGTRWVSTQRICIPISTPSSTHFDFSATATAFGRWAAGDEFDLWLIEWVAVVQVLTTNTGAAYWTGDLRKVDHDDSSSTSIASFDTSANSPDVVYTKRVSIGAALGVGSNFESGFVTAGKVGSPGNCRLIPGHILARYIVT